MLKNDSRLSNSAKAVTLLATIVGSVLLTLGGISWVIGLLLLSVSLIIRVALALAPARNAEEKLLQAIFGEKARTVEEQVNQPATKIVQSTPSVRVKVIGVGGGASNAVERMCREPLDGVEYLAVDTDARHLMGLQVPLRLKIGDKMTPLGGSGDPTIGRWAAAMSHYELWKVEHGADMVFIVVGMGGGTGTGACNAVAEIAKETGALTVAVVTMPFSFEGERRRKTAEEGIAQLKNYVDAIIVIPNDRLLAVAAGHVTIENAFRLADDVVHQAVQAIAELVTKPGEINLDFADLGAILRDAGFAWLGIGSARGENRAAEAARAAISSPMLDARLEGAKGIMLTVSGGLGLTLTEVHEVAEVVESVVDPDANIIFGMVTDPELKDEIKVVILATGFPIAEGYGVRASDVDRLVADALGRQSQVTEEMEIPPFLRRLPPRRQ